MIPDELVERIRESADIVQIIGEYVPLKRMGTDYRGPCPFHQGTHRNFSVSARRNMYYCFVCHEGGDVFTFLKKRLGIEWPAAVKMVASRAGIEVPDSGPRQEGKDPREPVWELNATAAEYFTRMLWEDEHGADARAYLAGRGLDRESSAQFGLGYAPREIGLLRSYMEGLGFGEERLLAAGLLVQRDEGAVPRPRFRDRLIFPIHDVLGHCVGFGGRLLGPGEPKYLNSSDSEVFSKGRLLYGLHWARNAIRKEQKVILVEGYFDVVRLVAAGVENVVAPLGTALTQEQAALLRRYAPAALLLYDSDNAGLKATFRAGDILLGQGMSVHVVTLPKGEDPDTYVAGKGRKGLESLIESAVDVFDRKVQLLERSGFFRDLAHRRRAIDHLLPTIRAASDPVTRDLYLTRASEASGVGKETLLTEAAGARSGGRNVAAAGARSRVPAQETSAAEADAGAVRPDAGSARERAAPRERKLRRMYPDEAAERLILAGILQVPARIDWLAERAGESDFMVPAHRELFRAMLEGGAELSIAELERSLSEDGATLLQELLERGREIIDMQTTLDDSLRRLELRALRRRRNEIVRQMRVASADEQDALTREKMQLQKRAGELLERQR